jgi:hypothetical protein
MPNGASVQAVTVLAEAPVVGQPGAVVGKAKGPSRRLVTVTICVISGARPTAPFHVNAGVNGAGAPVHGIAPLDAPSVVAGSPRTSAVPLYGVLKIYGNWVEGWPAATSAKPESGPNANMNVCVPSAIVE